MATTGGKLESLQPPGDTRGMSFMSIEKLDGISNYSTWKFMLELYLIHDDLWEYTQKTPDSTDVVGLRRDQKARVRICMMVQSHCQIHVRNAKTAKEAWDSLRSAFEDKGLNNRCRLLSKLVSLKLEQFTSIRGYVTELMLVAQQLRDIGKEVDDELLAALMLQGLPEEYNPMRLALENSNIDLTTDYVKTKLLQMDQGTACASSSNSTSAALTAKTKNQNQKKFVHRNKDKEKKIRCFICDGSHKARDCPDNPKQKAKAVNMVTATPTATETTTATVIALHTRSEEKQDDAWVIDSGASMHMSGRKDWMSKFAKAGRKVEVSCANGGKMYGEGYGIVADKYMNIENVLYVPELTSNLLSVSSTVKKGKVVVFSNRGCEIFDEREYTSSGQPCVTGVLDKGVYKIKSPSLQVCALASTATMELWHRRMAHLGIRNLQLLRDRMATGVSFEQGNDRLDCVACLMGKQTRKPFERNKATRAKGLLELVHSDISGPMSENSFGGFRYYITFIDDFSRKTFVFFLKQKSEAFEKMKEFKSFAETQTGKKLKVLRTDNGREYCNKRFDEFLREHGVKHQLTIAYTPQQNGVAERANRTIAEKARTMLQEAGLPVRFWAEAVNTAVYLKNRSPTIAVKNKTPEEVWSDRKIDLSNLRVFGCRAFMHIPDEKRTKWDAKSKELVFVGYCEESKGYRLVNRMNGELHRARDVIFFENQMSTGGQLTNTEEERETTSIRLENYEERQAVFHKETVLQRERDHSDDGRDAEIIEEEDEQWTSFEDRPEEEQLVDTGPVVEERRYPLRNRKPVEFPDHITYETIVEERDPRTVEEALSRNDAKQWKVAIQEELDALKKNQTWVLVEPNQASNIIDSKWLFRIKKEAGNKIRYKARLVARGFRQRKGIDYDETFSPVVRHSSLRLLIALAAQMRLRIDHMDVKTAFLNGSLQEEVYMRQPPHFEEKGKEDHVCLLKRSLYGLKQAPRSWNSKLHSELESLNFQRCNNEPCVYTRRNEKNLIILAVYVDDILIFYNNAREMQKVKRELMSKFEMKDLGKAELFLGMRIRQENDHIKIDQEEYIEKLLRRFGMENCKTVATPAVLGQHLKKPEGSHTPSDKIPYRELIGSLMYLAVCTRPDIAHAVNTMSQFCNCYEEIHWSAAKRILRYLKGTKKMGLVYSNDACHTEVQGFSDADHGGNIIDRKSYSGNVFTVSGGAVSWQSTKQRSIALSTAEAEYVSLSEAAKEAIFLRRFLGELMDGRVKAITVHTDSQSAMAIAQNPVHHQQTKHIDLRYHFVREALEEEIIKLKYLSTNEMVADIMTKSVPKSKHEFCRKAMGLQE